MRGEQMSPDENHRSRRLFAECLMLQCLGCVCSAHVLPAVQQADECLMVECLRLRMFSHKEQKLTRDHSVTVIVLLS